MTSPEQCMVTLPRDSNYFCAPAVERGNPRVLSLSSASKSSLLSRTMSSGSNDNSSKTAKKFTLPYVTTAELKLLCQAMWDWTRFCPNCPDALTNLTNSKLCQAEDCPWDRHFKWMKPFFDFYRSVTDYYTHPVVVSASGDTQPPVTLNLLHSEAIKI